MYYKRFVDKRILNDGSMTEPLHNTSFWKHCLHQSKIRADPTKNTRYATDLYKVVKLLLIFHQRVPILEMEKLANRVETSL